MYAGKVPYENSVTARPPDRARNKKRGRESVSGIFPVGCTTRVVGFFPTGGTSSPIVSGPPDKPGTRFGHTNQTSPCQGKNRRACGALPAHVLTSDSRSRLDAFYRLRPWQVKRDAPEKPEKAVEKRGKAEEKPDAHSGARPARRPVLPHGVHVQRLFTNGRPSSQNPARTLPPADSLPLASPKPHSPRPE